MMPSPSTATPHFPRSIASAIAVVALAAACTGEPTPESDHPPQAAPAASASAAGGGAATLQLGPETYEFERVICDLDDTVDDDILARASGTAPDGRRMSLEVERREVGDRLDDRVTIYFGNLAEGDHWNARASGQPGGSWSTAIAGGEPLDGPLVVIDGTSLTADGTFEHETRDETQPGSLRVMCVG